MTLVPGFTPSEKQLAVRFKPGTSANPGGRPRGLERRIRELVDFDKIALILQDIVHGIIPEGMSMGSTVKIRDRIEAAKLLYDRGWGKAKITVDIAADVSSRGLAGVRVDDMDDAALDVLEEAITRAIDPKKRKAIDAKATEVRAVEVKTPAAVAQDEPAQDHTPAQAAPEPIAPEPAQAIVEAVQAPAPVALLRHVFQGSANVHSVTLDLGSNEFEVQFTSGARYRYARGSRELVESWKLAVSAGRFFNQEIRAQADRYPPIGKRIQ